MKTMISAIVVAFALAVAGPAFAGDVSKAKTQADCEKHGGVWNADTSTCGQKSGSGY